MNFSPVFSENATRLSESATIAIATTAKNLIASGKKLHDFSLGEPDFNTPDPIKSAAISAIHDNFSRYTDVSGIKILRKKIAEKLRAENSLPYDESEIIVTNGAKQALFNALCALLNPGDVVAIPAPYWVSYPEIVNFCGGENLFLATDENFKITPQILNNALKNAKKMPKILIMNSPSNPTGAVYTEDELRALWDVIRETEMLVLSDEIYEKILFTDAKYKSFGALDPEALARTITINGLSKAVAMTGWRIGYSASKIPALNKIMKNLQSQSTSNVCSIAQAAAVAAFSDETKKQIQKMRDIFHKRRDLGAQILKNSEILAKNLRLKSPDGAFYFFIEIIPERHKNSMIFCKNLLHHADVVAVPGVAFGAEGHFRLSFACAEDEIIMGLEKIATYLAKS